MDLSHLSDMKLLALVVEAGGFRAAAPRNGLPASSLSNAVQRLEDREGVRLLNRTTRSVTPTEAGLELLSRIRPALVELELAFDGIASDIRRPGR
jgi:DNA-binding transcriptional LysR family regulator